MNENITGNSIITIEEMENLMKKYNIGKRPLSLILGWGEVTMARYVAGDFVPSQERSDLLKSLANSPEKFMEYLEAGKGLITPIAYSKSKAAVGKTLNINLEKDSNLDMVASYIIKNNEETTNLSLQKLLYYAQVFSYVIYNKPLFKAKCDAWQHGPVYSDIYMKYKGNGSEVITTDDSVMLDSESKKLVDGIINSFGCYSGKVLCYFTHSESPWKDVYHEQNTVINENKIKELAEEIKNEFDIETVDDISRYSDKMIKAFRSKKN